MLNSIVNKKTLPHESPRPHSSSPSAQPMLHRGGPPPQPPPQPQQQLKLQNQLNNIITKLEYLEHFLPEKSSQPSQPPPPYEPSQQQQQQQQQQQSSEILEKILEQLQQLQQQQQSQKLQSSQSHSQSQYGEPPPPPYGELQKQQSPQSSQSSQPRQHDSSNLTHHAISEAVPISVEARLVEEPPTAVEPSASEKGSNICFKDIIGDIKSIIEQNHVKEHSDNINSDIQISGIPMDTPLSEFNKMQFTMIKFYFEKIKSGD